MPEPSSVLVFAAHPDDETIGMGARLAGLSGVRLFHVTDGAPRDMRDAAAYGFRTREEYAGARREELLAALQLAGIPEDHACSMGFADQEASYNLAGLASRIAAILRECRPAVLFAPPYEGGHPDHDATAFAVHAACTLAGTEPELYEYALYHCRRGAFVPQEFLPREECPVTEVALAPDVRERKRRMIACFRTQSETLRPFSVDVEQYRPAPRYDFSEPPAADCIYYDRFPWGIRSDEWREKARAALDALSIRGPI